MFTKQHLGKPIEFLGYSHESSEPDTTYYGNIVEIMRRGIRISYYVPDVHRECECCLLTADAKKRVKLA